MACRHCASEVESRWRYCASCGSPTSHVNVVESHAFTGPGPHKITLSNDGPAAVEFEARVVAGEDQVEISPTQGAVSPTAVLTLNWKGKDQAQAQIRLELQDGKRTDLWSPRPRRTVDITVVRQAGLSKLTFEPATLIFHPMRRSRRLTLRNTGNLSERIERIEAPMGVDIRPQGGFELAPGESRDFEVVSSLTGVKIQFYRTSGVLDVPVFSLPPRKLNVPGCYVGIDFGTAKTSVTYREFQGSTLVVLPILGDKKRVPTFVYCPSVPGKKLVFGERALEEWKNANRTGTLVTELKTRVREHPNRPIAGATGATPKSLLTEYLRELLIKAIVPHLERNNPQALGDANVAFTFSVPVLDQGPELEAYVDTLIECAESAGYTEYGHIEWNFEPVCAASYILRNAKTPVPPGTRIMIFDSGGGTTDICTGTVEFQDGKFNLKDIKTGTATLSGQTQFGGAKITWALGKWFEQRSENHREFLKSAIQLTSDIPKEAPDDPQKDAGFLEVEQPTVESEEWHLQPWRDKYPEMYNRIDRAKCLLVESGGPSQAFYILPPDDFPLELLRTELDRLTDFAFDALRPDVKRAMPERGTISAFLVGGNSRLPRLMDNLRDEGLLVKSWTEEDPEMMDIAVAGGAAYIREMINDVLPYTLIVTLDGKPHRFEAGTPDRAGHDKMLAMFDVTPGAATSLSLEAELQSERHPLMNADGLLAIDQPTLVRFSARIADMKLTITATTQTDSHAYRELVYEI